MKNEEIFKMFNEEDLQTAHHQHQEEAQLLNEHLLRKYFMTISRQDEEEMNFQNKKNQHSLRIEENNREEK